MPDRRLALILALYLAFGFGYSLLMPVWEAPDERAHYSYAFRLARTGEPPPPDENYEAFQPPLYYWLASGPIRWIAGLDPALARPFLPPKLPPAEGSPRYGWDAGNYQLLLAPLVLRWLGVLAGAAALVLVHAGARTAAPARPELALAAAALTAGIPQFIHTTASVNNDVLAILAGALLFYLLARAARGRGNAMAYGAAILLGLLLPAVVKLTVLPVGLAAAAAATWRLRDVLGRKMLPVMLAGAVVLFLGVLWVTWRFPELFTGLRLELAYRLLAVRGDLGAESPFAAVYRLARSFWGRVGYLAVGVPAAAAAVLSLLLAWGLGKGASNRVRRLEVVLDTRIYFLCWLALGLAAAMVGRNYLSTPQMQGRFLFPTLGPLALLAAEGWLLGAGNRGRLLPVVIAAALALVNLHLWLTGVIPVYFQPFLDR